MTHFELTEKTRQIKGTTLYRIRLTEDHPRWGAAGTLGGWVEYKENLQGDAWIGENACVFGSARVFGDSWIYGNAWISGNSRISSAQIYGNTYIV